MEEFKDDDGNMLARIVRGRDAGDGHQFFTEPSDILQVGLACFKTDHVFPIHVHNPVERQTVGTMEVLIVLAGIIRVSVFSDPNDQEHSVKKVSWRLGAGDAVLIYPGTVHSVTVLDDAKIFEVKSGPYMGKEADKIF